MRMFWRLYINELLHRTKKRKLNKLAVLPHKDKTIWGQFKINVHLIAPATGKVSWNRAHNLAVFNNKTSIKKVLILRKK